MGFDTLTGIANRRLFEFQGRKAMAMARRHDDDLGLVLLRLDNLEALAGRHGIERAKVLLNGVAARLRANARSHDTCGRLSRSRFGLLLPGAREFGAHKFAIRLLAMLQDSEDEVERECVVSLAATATSNFECNRFEDLLAHAVERLQQSIDAGGNRVVSSFCN